MSIFISDRNAKMQTNLQDLPVYEQLSRKEMPGRFGSGLDAPNTYKHLCFQRRPCLVAKTPFSWKSKVIIVNLMKISKEEVLI